MNAKRSIVRFSSVAVAILVGYFAGMNHSQAKNCKSKKDIVETAAKAGQFDTLVKAIKAADLVGTLKGKGPFTVFAPTDQAFAKLSTDTLTDLLKPENKEKLKSILTYHVVPGKVRSDKVIKLKLAKTINGQSLAIKVKSGGVLVDNAKVVKTDIDSSNGVIHVIDTVLLPPQGT